MAKVYKPLPGDEFMSDHGEKVVVISSQEFAKSGGICLCRIESFDDGILTVANRYLTFTDLRKMKRKVLPNE